jgi:ABC-type Fe3+ transport system substrate-binding protein
VTRGTGQSKVKTVMARRGALFLLLLTAASQACAQGSPPAPDWGEQRARLVAAAQREGKVVILAPPDTQVRQALPAAFKTRYGISVDYLGGRSSESAAKMRAEREAGIYTIDVALSGIQTMATIFYREKMLVPLRPLLIDPEVIDPGKWKAGRLWFMDPDQQYILRLFNTAGANFYVNTRFAKPSEFHLARDLLDPKWKGKISMHDPTVPGTGSNQAARFYVQFGEDYVRRLYVDQQPGIARDRRQVTDWLARGRYPISIDAERDEVERLKADGLPVEAVYNLSDMPGTLSAGVGELAVLDHAPHPNAAQLFANWIASKEGLEVYARARTESPARNDTDEASFLPAEIIPRPGVNYFDSYEWQFTLSTKEQVRLRMKELMQQR